jgi:hypothetical protein
VKAGLAVESDRMSAQVNVAARKEELIAAQGELELAWAELRETMGRPELEASGLKPIEPHGFAQLPLAQELATAAKTRPDLMALGEAQSAQSAAVGAAKSELGPRVSAYGNWEQDQSTTAGAGGDNWVAGVQITVDILPVGKSALLARESAGKEKIDAQAALLREHLRLEVSQAHIHQQTAELSLETARAGMYGTVEFANGLRQAILIPRSAVVMRGSLACAYVLDGQQIARLRTLTLGAAHGNLVEVLSGIAAGEKLVDEPSDRDLEGKRIAATSIEVRP